MHLQSPAGNQSEASLVIKDECRPDPTPQSGEIAIARALFIASDNLVTYSIMCSWLNSGNTIAEVWSQADDPLLKAPARPWGRPFSQFETSRLLRDARVRVRSCPPLRTYTEAVGAALATGAEALVSCMTLQRIPNALIEAFPGRAVNFHPALLPHYRGPSPTAGMLIDGVADRHGGVTLHLLSEGFDEGPIIAQRACPRSQARDLVDWQLQIAAAAGELARDDLPAYLRGERKPIPQGRAEGSYRRLKEGETDLGARLTLAELRARLSAFGPHHVHRWARTTGGKIAVTGLLGVLGERSGLPEHIRTLSLDADLADFRVRLRRRTPLFQLAKVAARHRAMHRAARQMVEGT